MCARAKIDSLKWRVVLSGKLRATRISVRAARLFTGRHSAGTGRRTLVPEGASPSRSTCLPLPQGEAASTSYPGPNGASFPPFPSGRLCKGSPWVQTLASFCIFEPCDQVGHLIRVHLMHNEYSVPPKFTNLVTAIPHFISIRNAANRPVTPAVALYLHFPRTRLAITPRECRTP